MLVGRDGASGKASMVGVDLFLDELKEWNEVDFSVSGIGSPFFNTFRPERLKLGEQRPLCLTNHEAN